MDALVTWLAVGVMSLVAGAMYAGGRRKDTPLPVRAPQRERQLSHR